jgi:telomerase reverse transcriptase
VQEEVDMLLSRGRSLGVSNLRFLPKPSSLRAITNLSSVAKLNCTQFPAVNQMGRRESKPVNTQLFDLFSVLKFEKSRREDSTSCMGYRDIHSRLTTFSQKLPSQAGQRTPFYAVHLDVTNSFDSLAPRLVYTIIQKKIVCQKSYLLRRYATVMISNQTIKRSFMKVATTRELCEPFLEFAKSLNVRNCILVDMVSYPVIDRLKILSQLKSHLFHNIVKFRGQFFRQQKGVPQGSCISSLLCSFYYDEMVIDYLPRINPETELLIHYVDDFFLMTHDPEKVKTFLETMNKGISEYNCFANAAKTNSNFKVNEDGSLTLDEHKDWMAWCGVLINTTNLEVRSDYTRYGSKKIRDHLSIITHPRPLLNLHQLMRRAVVLKCQPIFLDCQVQSEKTVLCNVYQVFLLLAVKTHTALRTLQLRGLRLRKYTKFLHCLILQSARYFHSRARTKCRENQSKDASTSFTVPLELCTWLCCHAYRRVLQSKDPRGYQLLVKILSSQTCTLSDTMGLQLMKRCLKATTASGCQPIIRLKC